MGSRNGPYNADFPEGTLVRIVSRDKLERFRIAWRFDYPLEPQQLAFAGRTARVAQVDYYHVGDELYWLANIRGVWHPKCLDYARQGRAA